MPTAPPHSLPSRRAGIVWGIGALLTMNFSIVALTFWLAGSDPSVAVEPDYYRKALEWDRSDAQRRAGARLAWSVTLTHSPAAASSTPRLNLTLRDRDNNPVEGAAVHATLFRHDRAADRSAADFSEESPGLYTAPTPPSPASHATLWRAQLLIQRGLESFTTDSDFQIGPEPPPTNLP